MSATTGRANAPMNQTAKQSKRRIKKSPPAQAPQPPKKSIKDSTESMEIGRSSGFAQNAKELNKSSGVGASIVKDSLMFKEIAEQHDSNAVPRKSSNTIRIEGGAANEVSEDKGKKSQQYTI